MRVGVEGRAAVVRIARPPTDRDLLRVHRVAHDEVVRRWVGRQAGEKADREVERPPPRVYRGRAAPVGSAELCEHEGGPSGRGEVWLDALLVVGVVLVVLVEPSAPRDLLGRRVDGYVTRYLAHGPQQVARDLADGSVRSERDASRAPVAVLD